MSLQRGVVSALVLAFVALPATAQLFPSRSTEPRIPLIESADAPINLIKVMANHPDLMAAWGPFGSYLLQESTLPARDRELLILRTAYLNEAAYEWGHHSRLGREAGITDEELARIAKGSNAAGWSSFDRGLLRSAEQLNRYGTIDDRTWAYVDARYDEKQLMDMVFTVGQYRMVAMALKTFRVPLDEGLEGFPSAD